MRLLLTLSMIFTMSFAHAEFKFQDVDYNEEQVQEIVETQIGTDFTCVDDYIDRQIKLKKFLIWAPPVTVVAAPAAFMVGGYTAAFISSTLFTSGWAAIGYTVLGAVGSGVGVLGTFIGMEFSKGIEFANNRKMIEIITASHENNYENKKLIKLHNIYNKKYSAKPMSIEQIAQAVVDLDESGKLCNGEVRGYINPKKAKYSLAKRRHLMRYLFTN